MPRPDPLVLAAVAALSAFLAVVVIAQAAVTLRERRVRRRALDSIRDAAAPNRDGEHPAVLLRTGEQEEGLLVELSRRIPQLWDLNHLLTQSGMTWTLKGFLARMAGSALVAAGLTLLLSRNIALAAVALVVAGAAPWALVRWKKGQRLRRLEAQLPDAIDLMARAVRAGHPLSEGLRMASDELPEPLASEFRITFEEQRFGLPFEEALMGLGDRVEVVDVRILITAILVQREVGGNLSEILEEIAETMRARFNLKRQVRVYTAQGRMSGYTLAALPIIVGLLISLINPPYMRTLFTEPLGKGLLAGAAALQVVGFLWIRRIVDVRY